MSAQRQTYVDDHGRVCVGACGEYLIWDHFQKCGNGRRRATCRECTPEHLKPCLRCGDLTQHRYCPGCKKVVTERNNGLAYLVVRDPHPLNPFRGGILPKRSFNKTLEKGYFDVGMVLEMLIRGKHTGKLYQVIGPRFSEQRLKRIALE